MAESGWLCNTDAPPSNIAKDQHALGSEIHPEISYTLTTRIPPAITSANGDLAEEVDTADDCVQSFETTQDTTSTDDTLGTSAEADSVASGYDILAEITLA